MSDLFNILSNSNKDIDNQKLMDYLAGKLSGTEKHEVEAWMTENDFASEAIEGLQSLKDPAHANVYVEQLNNQLSRHLKQKPKRRTRKLEFNLTNAIIAVLVILALTVMAVWIIHRAK